MGFLKVSQGETVLVNSTKTSVKPNQKYHITTKITCKKGIPFAAYVVVVAIDHNEREISRYIRWISDFSGNAKNYDLIFNIPEHTNSIIAGYRINVETPRKGDFEIELDDLTKLRIQEVDSTIIDEFDDLADYVQTIQSMTEEEERILEKKMVWIIGSLRSGTTWLATQLLNHPENIIWNEPFIGRHLDINYKLHFRHERYFFSTAHKKNWLPYLKKMILVRTYSQAQTLSKNIMIKEPGAGGAADIIMDCFPNSKLIFLLRDGRDVIDSLIDAAKPGSWAWDPDHSYEFILTDDMRYLRIKEEAQDWKRVMESMYGSYERHDPKLRLLVKYEDLLQNTLVELKKIYDFLDIKTSDDFLQHLIEKYDFAKIPESQKGSGKFYRIAKPGAWKNNFTEKEQNLIHSIMSETMKKLGYDI